jgi:hypothetical protein
MGKKIKRLFGIVLSLALIAGLMPQMSMVARAVSYAATVIPDGEETGTNYTTFGEALDAGQLGAVR